MCISRYLKRACRRFEMGALLGKCFRLYLHMNENTELFLYPLDKVERDVVELSKRRWQQEGVNDIICGRGKTEKISAYPTTILKQSITPKGKLLHSPLFFFFLANKCMHSQHWGSTKILPKNKYQHQLL